MGYALRTWASEGFYQGGNKGIFQKFFQGGAKLVKFIFSHSKLRKQAVLLKFSKPRWGQGPYFPTPMTEERRQCCVVVCYCSISYKPISLLINGAKQRYSADLLFTAVSKNLDSIFLTNCERNPRFFCKGLTDLKVLNLMNNELHALSDDAFYYLLQLRTLHLDSNKLHHLKRNPFDDIERLEVLTLQSNFLRKWIHPSGRLTALKRLELDRNWISKIVKHNFHGMKSLV